MMMMHQNPAAVFVPPWTTLYDEVEPVFVDEDCVSAALQMYNDDSSDSDAPADAAIDAYSCDEFRMYEFKIRRCVRGRSHDWTECPYAHPGEKARRRDPRKYHYSGTACPDFRKGACKRGDGCDMAHGVFECWLHPARYRTQPCKDGTSCRRRVCFFAHTPDQLRVLPQSPPKVSASPFIGSYDGSPMRQQQQQQQHMMMFSSPPMSPTAAGEEVLASLRKLQLGKVKSMPVARSLGLSFGSPTASMGGAAHAGFRGGAGFCSLPPTPTRVVNGFKGCVFVDQEVEEEEHVDRVVESGRALRAKMYERLSKENGAVEMQQEAAGAGAGPDVGWVSELLM